MENETDLELRLTLRFGARAGAQIDEETDANMRVRIDIARLDRIVAVAFEDPNLVAN